jgi:hypothetical protein
MNASTIQPPLSNLQVELLKLFSANVPDEDLLFIKKMIANYLLEKARDRADKIWDEKGYSDEKLLAMLTEE